LVQEAGKAMILWQLVPGAAQSADSTLEERDDAGGQLMIRWWIWNDDGDAASAQQKAPTTEGRAERMLSQKKEENSKSIKVSWSALTLGLMLLSFESWDSALTVGLMLLSFESWNGVGVSIRKGLQSCRKGGQNVGGLKVGRTGLAAIRLIFVHQKASPFRADRMMRQKEGENGKLREVSGSVVRCFDAFYMGRSWRVFKQTGPALEAGQKERY
jgi:hypothetical protein